MVVVHDAEPDVPIVRNALLELGLASEVKPALLAAPIIKSPTNILAR